MRKPQYILKEGKMQAPMAIGELDESAKDKYRTELGLIGYSALNMEKC